jgi:pantoate kinase
MEAYKRATANTFAPCPTTAFFVPNIEPQEPARTGSWGAGLCLGAGVAARVEVAEADTPDIQVTRAGVAEDEDARTTREALRQLLENRARAPLAVDCTVHEGAPAGQGFGVSGASALAAAFGLARCLGAGRSDALRAAHLAEVRNRSGLSDVAASFLGGAVVRQSPGLPPYGSTKRLPAKGHVVVCTTGPQLDTSTLLRDEAVMDRVGEAGRGCVEALAEEPSLPTILAQGERFARDTDLVAEDTLRALDVCREAGRGMVAMLGNTVVAYGDTEELAGALGGFGDPVEIPIDEGGLRTVDDETMENLQGRA